ncbi:karyopherin [Schizosaccharomyces cryophilus OY26]|uniref:Karyopherin n=1 Tax=Schizosaccharomyces cryophilus (strain OY26 / ATCC MYA-4695 / CBS 11777 / NBRC 106824 / NRRL Y48691) TaxID=653667 RepID=S9XGD2_SCHCR|nr:karyopherin [Schizosaccharomyces cryophilus OY26]EPY52731.1 karyopherin [Schizosaccharomyces cryophilus OY26]
MDESNLYSVLEALNVVHAPESSREARFEAQGLLDNLKESFDNSGSGFQLLNLNGEVIKARGYKIDIHVIRHFALSLFEASINSNWKNYDDQTKHSLISFLCAFSLQNSDALSVYYVRNKLASVFIEIVKRDWYSHVWREDFDLFLQSLWGMNVEHRQLSSFILRGIMEDLYQYDDPVASLRSHVLFNALISVLSSSRTLHKLYPSGLPYSVSIPENNEGWLNRWSSTLESETDALESLKCFKSCLSWVATDSIIEANIVPRICNILVNGPLQLKTHAIDCIYICVTRSMEIDDPLWATVEELLSSEGLYTLHQVYSNISQSIQIDDLSSSSGEYILLKKLAETIVALGQYNYLDSSRRKAINLDFLDTYSALILEIMRHPSLLISAISQHFWVLALRDPLISKHDKFQQVYPQLLSIASERLLRFEDAVVDMIPKSPIAIFLAEDVEGVAAVHSFCGNYRRFMFDIVRLTVSIKPLESLSWVQNNFQNILMNNINQIQSEMAFSSKTTPLYLIMDVGFSTIEASLHGITRWNENVTDSSTYELILQSLFLWCKQLVEIEFKDPMLITRLISVLVLFTSILARENTNLLGVVLEKIISAVTYNNSPSLYGFSDLQKVNEMRSRCCFELVRLGELMPNPLMNIFDQLQSTIDQLGTFTTLSGSEIVMLKTFLFVISQFSDINHTLKNEFFEKLVGPVVSTWLDAQPPVSTPVEFLNHVKLPQMSEYLFAKYPYNADYTKFELDADASSFQTDLEDSRKWLWPIKCLGRFCEATYSNRRIHPSEFDEQKTLWLVILPNIVPGLLKLIEQLHCCYDPSFISSLGTRNSTILQKSIVERFWLHGVSQISKHQFLEESYKMDVSANKLIHSFGHFLRRLREYCYGAIASFMRLGEPFFAIPGLSTAFLTSFFNHASGLSLHQWTSVVNVIIKPYCLHCPPELRDDCLLPLLPPLLSELDRKLVNEWRSITERGLLVEEDTEETEDLSEEMIEESLLRHLTYATAKLITETFLQITPTQSRSTITSDFVEKESSTSGSSKLSDYVLDNAIICEPLLSTLCHLLVIHDSRTVTLVVNAFIAIVPLLVSERTHSIVREFVCQKVFQTIIMAINDSYFEQLQSDFIRLACIILSYSQGITDSSFRVLASIPALASQENLLSTFANRFREASTLKIQKALLMRLLNSGRIVPRTDRRAMNSAVLDVSAKEMLKRFEKSVSLQDDTNKGDILSKDEDTGLANLFG